MKQLVKTSQVEILTIDPKCISQITTPTLLLETLYFSHSKIIETPGVGIHQIQQKLFVNNILKTGTPTKKGLGLWEGETTQQKTDSTVTKKCS